MPRSETLKPVEVMGLAPRPAVGRGSCREHGEQNRGVSHLASVRSVAAVTALAFCSAFVSSRALAVGVAAGTNIDNTAQVTYSVGATSATVSSNTVSIKVAEILDVVVTL